MKEDLDMTSILAGLIIGLSYISIGYFFTAHIDNTDHIRMLTLIFGLFIILYLTITGVSKTVRENDVQTKIDNGYMTYIDGQEVDSTKIDIDQYTVTVNDDTKELYLTKRP